MTQYVLLKRDLYECPGHMGYTGIRDKAGTWPAEDFAHHGIPIKEKYTPKERDSYAIPFDVAPEFTNECFHDLKEAHLRSKIEEEGIMTQIGEEHCSRWGGIPQAGLTEFNRRSIGLLCSGFGMGPWNIPVNWDRVKWGSERHTEFITTGHGLATWDFNRLTRLVIGAHDECIRVEISPKAFRYLSIEMWPRAGREGGMAERHPTIEQAITSYRRSA